jgi:hypothetical protein
MANIAVNATISARDAASKNIKTVNKALGTLGNTASQIGADFRKVALGIAGVAAGVGAFTVSAIKGAAADEAATAKLTAALKARKLGTESVLAAVERQIIAGQKLAFTDDEVRASIEASTRFTKKYSQATKIQNVAMELARATGMSLADATIAVGKAYQGNGGKLLKTLGITGKVVKGQDALNKILAKTKGSAAAYANTLEGSFSVVSIQAAELKEQFGAAFLPAVTKLFKGLAPYMDRFSGIITAMTPKLQRFADQLVTKILDKLPMLMGQFESEFPKAIIAVEQFIDKIAGIGKGADSLLGPGGSITLLVSGIAAAFGGLKGVIAANLVKGGLDPFTALIVANITAQVPAALASALTGQIVAKAVAAFGASTAAAAAGGAAASAAGGVGAAAATAGLIATATAALPFILVAGGVVAAGVAMAALMTKQASTPAEIAAAARLQASDRSGMSSAEGNNYIVPQGPGGILGSILYGQSVGTSFGAPGATTMLTSNVYIGTGKVDTVISDSINRTGTFKRGR